METKEITLGVKPKQAESGKDDAFKDAAFLERAQRVEDEETRNYLLDRVLPQIAWHGEKAAKCKTMYQRLMTANIALSALIPAFSICADSGAVKVAIAFLGSSTMAINAYVSMRNYREIWAAYKQKRATLIHTLVCYFNKAEAFSDAALSQQDLNLLLVNTCEAILRR